MYIETMPLPPPPPALTAASCTALSSVAPSTPFRALGVGERGVSFVRGSLLMSRKSDVAAARASPLPSLASAIKGGIPPDWTIYVRNGVSLGGESGCRRSGGHVAGGEAGRRVRNAPPCGSPLGAQS